MTEQEQSESSMPFGIYIVGLFDLLAGGLHALVIGLFLFTSVSEKMRGVNVPLFVLLLSVLFGIALANAGCLLFRQRNSGRIMHLWLIWISIPVVATSMALMLKATGLWWVEAKEGGPVGERLVTYVSLLPLIAAVASSLYLLTPKTKALFS